MKIGLIYAVSENGVIGNKAHLPWKVEGEQVLFQAMTYNAGLIVGRKTFEEMGALPNRLTCVVTSSPSEPTDTLIYATSVEEALETLKGRVETVFFAGGSEIYKEGIKHAQFVMKSTIHQTFKGDVSLQLPLSEDFTLLYSQTFISNVNYTFEIYQRKE